MSLSTDLLDVLVDPEDKGSLFYLDDESALYNPRLKRRYTVKNNIIPVLLVDEAESVDVAEHERLTAKVQEQKLTPTGRKDEGHRAPVENEEP